MLPVRMELMLKEPTAKNTKNAKKWKERLPTDPFRKGAKEFTAERQSPPISISAD
jgi:hypothetical protein